mmetsp:Transcript_20565/g.57055  ORF Transcript_20565/g.57055 Transcript_20565/m.57055 type:complete len:154 (+) Transcript_20565:138-599(+)
MAWLRTNTLASEAWIRLWLVAFAASLYAANAGRGDATNPPRVETRSEPYSLQEPSRQGRTALQAANEWEFFSVLDFGGFYQAAVQASDADRSIHIIVKNHITAAGRGLGTVLKGRLKVTGACGPKISATENHVTLREQYEQDVDILCQLYLNE